MKYRYDIRKGITKIKTRATVVVSAVVIGILSLAIAVAIPFAAKAAPPTIINGGFENGNGGDPFVTLSSPDSTDIQGWSVTSGSIDYIGNYWQPQDGSHSIDMSGLGPGAISQTVSTVAGHTYTLSFYMAGNTDGGNAVKNMDVDSGAAPTLYSFNTAGFNRTNMGWQAETYTFTATGSSTVLTFRSLENNPYGPALDDVSISLNSPTNVNQCKNGGWLEYSNPAFKNQGDCVSWVQHNVLGNGTPADSH